MMEPVNQLLEDDWIECEEIGEILLAPAGTEFDMEFLASLNIEAWDSFHFLNYVNGKAPWTARVAGDPLRGKTRTIP